jgi:hypothetical protein
MNANDQFGRLAMNASDGANRLAMSANDGSDSGSDNGSGSDHGNQDLVSTQESEPDKSRIDYQLSSFALASGSSRIVARAQEVPPRGSDASDLQESQISKRSPLAENLTNCNSNNTTNSLKECVLCGATKTPMWRSGPQGPKVTIPYPLFFFISFAFYTEMKVENGFFICCGFSTIVLFL